MLRMANRRGKLGSSRNWWTIAGVTALAIAVVAAGYGVVVAATREDATATTSEYIPPPPPQIASKTVDVVRPADRPLRVLLAGDSLTYGLYSSVPETSWASIFTRELEKGGAVEISRGEKSGADASTVGNLTSVPADLDLAIVELGTNDVGKTPIDLFRTQYNDLLDKITSDGKTPLVCAGAWGKLGGDAGGTDPYDNVISQACGERGGKFVDLSNDFSNSANRGPEGVPTWGGTSDEFHPNDTGHARIASRILERVAVL